MPKDKHGKGLKVMQFKSYVMKHAIQLFLDFRTLPHLTTFDISRLIKFLII